MKRFQDLAGLLLRVATAVNFLSPVTSRFGLFGGSGWANFLVYAGKVNSFAPPALVPWLAVAATVVECVIPLLLLVGWHTRLAALGAAALTFLFAAAMTWSFGLKETLDYAVPVDCTSALLLATLRDYRWSLDAWLAKREKT